MVTFLATVHILACIGLITLVMLQDSKGGGMFSGQSSSNSVLGATGATTLAAQMTKIITIILAVTCIGLAMFSSQSQKSVIDSLPAQAAPTTSTEGMAASALSTDNSQATAQPSSAETTQPTTNK